MSLKTATLLAANCLLVSLLITLARWSVFTFGFVSYGDYAEIFQALGLLGILLQSVPLIIFFYVLNARQSGA